jgi:hypothetical protein
MLVEEDWEGHGPKTGRGAIKEKDDEAEKEE